MIVEKTADVEDDKFVLRQRIEWKGKTEVRTIYYSPELCSGCTLCVYACPTNAIQFHGYEMLLAGAGISIDHNSCCFCGICSSVCLDRAIEFKIDGNEKKPFETVGGAKKLESCVGCRVCYEVCPVKAVKIEPSFRVDDVHRREWGREGELKIDVEKCKKCGRCTLFCDALVAVKKDFDPESPNPFLEILLVEEKCDYCGLCESVCPNGAIEVKSESKVNEKIEDFEVAVSIDNCIECGFCRISCPYDGVIVNRSFDGSITVNWKRLERFCDWESCKLCINVCKSRAWYVRDGKLKLEPELCRFCRACMYACPENLIEVELNEIKINSDWGGFNSAIKRVIREEVAEVKRSWLEELEDVKSEEEREVVKFVETNLDEELTKKVLKLQKFLEKHSILLELNPEKFLKVLKEVKS